MNQPAPGQQPQPIPVKGGGGASIIIIIGVVLMVVVAIIGILAAIAIPNFIKYKCRSMQSEAKAQLKSGYVAQESFKAEFDRYASTMSEAKWEPRGTTVRYTYRVVEATDKGFTLEARGTGDMEGDLWRITEKVQLEHVENRCN